MNNKYFNEVKDTWGNSASFKEYEEKTKSYSKDKWNNISLEINEIFNKFACLLRNNYQPNSNETQELVKELQLYISNSFYECTNEILYNLGLMYVTDLRFKNNIDKFSDGNSEYIKSAIEIFCNR